MPGKKGGRMPASEYGRTPSAKGVGENSRRHDLEQQATPGLHGSDLQYGDRQALEQGQRIAPAQTQESATPQPPVNQSAQSPTAPGPGLEIPDPIDFLGSQQGDEFNVPQPQRQLQNHQAMNWLPIIRQLVVGPGSSGQLAQAFINQARELNRIGNTPAAMIDLGAVDAGLEAMAPE